LKRTILLGYGNPDRQDDGVAWHVLREVATRLGLSAPSSPDDEFSSTDNLDFLFSLQLTPEMAEDLAGYERICFVDAHTGNITEEVRLIAVESEFQHSPFTHHLTPQSLISMCETIYGHKPEAVLLSVRGYVFGFERDLSPATRNLIDKALELILPWLAEKCDGG
jgi:hydrogenase maturation protease